ncbi:MAG: hypothetical protein IJW08_08250 [Lentisphaeria bacterium]|nr:hypothetical protein [Lentisphaeria bacterium]
MKHLEKICSSFLSAWNMMIDIPLPWAEKFDVQESSSFDTAVMIPVAGAVPGVILAALGILLNVNIPCSAIWAFAAVIIMEMVNSGRSGKMVAEKIAEFIFKESAGSFVNSMVTFVILFKLAAFFAIANGENTGFILLFFVLVFSLEMYCATFGEENSIIKVESGERWKLYLIPGAIAFLWFWSYPLATLVSLAVTAGTALFFRKKVWSEDYIVNGNDVTFASGCAEVLLLLCSMIILG